MAESLIRTEVGALLEQLGSSQPTPGGGAVAALAGALAAALGRKACALTVGKPKFAEVEGRVRELDRRLDRAEKMSRRLVDEDAAAYGALSAAFKLDRADESRGSRIEQAAVLAAAVPLQVVVIAGQVGRDLARLRPICNPNLVSDVSAGAHLARAAIEAAAENVRANLPLLPSAQRGDVQAELEHALAP